MAKAITPQRYGPVALVTGASSGIGEQFARRLAALGFDLVLVARRLERLERLRDELAAAAGVNVMPVECDLGDPSQLRALLSALDGVELGLIVSNAGFGVRKGPYLDADIDAMEAMYRTNAIAPARLLHALVPGMVQRGRGGVIVTGSIEGDLAFPYSTAYAASKAFLHSLALGMWDELRESGVDVLLLAPGSTDTDAPGLQGISREQLAGVMSPREVADQALAQLGRRAHFTPGWHNRFLMRLLRLLPRAFATALAGRGMRQAIENSGRQA
jgi:short-subunit dehydrogenase